MKINVRNREAFTGAIFAKNRYATCGTNVVDSNGGMLVMPIPIGMQTFTVGGSSILGGQNRGTYGPFGGNGGGSYGPPAGPPNFGAPYNANPVVSV